MGRGRIVLALGAVLAAAPGAAQAATVSADRAVARTCHERLLPEGSAGSARVPYSPGAAGALTTRLTAASGDWDLAVFDAASGRLANASASAGRREVAVSAAAPGRPLVAQACRRGGGARTAEVEFDLHQVAAPAVPREPVSMVRVPLAGRTLEQLEATGLDVAHDVGAGGATVVLYSAAERARLIAAGFTFVTVVEDLRGQDLARVRADQAYAARVAASPLPSGRDGYRVLADYQAAIKSLASKYPSVARRIEIGKSLEGRPIEGLELAANVNGRDGRPLLAVLGLHHAREWPSGEMPMEFAQDLAEGYGKNERITSLLERVRVIALPVMNPDGFDVSRTAGPTPFDDQELATLPLSLTDGASYKRKNCRPTAGEPPGPCITRPAGQGVDLNRNYGAYWGGVGSAGFAPRGPDTAQDNPAAQNYRGEAPYSEPESETFHKLSSSRSIVTVISHHTFTSDGIWLRQPGFCKVTDDCKRDVDVVPDEAGMKSLGDAMGMASGWDSDLGWVIGEITGATEDWNYFTQGAYGYTPEQRGANFHPSFETSVVKEYVGTAPKAKGGVREALLTAGEQAANPSFHSVLLGVAPAGHVLRLRKSFATDTSIPELKVQDKLDFATTVPDSGFYNWHVNQSTRPLSKAPESYTLTCEAPGGEVKETRTVTIARGETQALDLACGVEAAVSPTAQPPAPPDRPQCADKRAPKSLPSHRSFGVTRTRVSVRGRAGDYGCRASGGLLQRRGQLARVLVAVARRSGRSCRFLQRSGAFSKRRSCSKPLYLPAQGLKTWKLTVKGTLPPGSYQVWSQALDTSGNAETRRRRVLTATLR
ncbi:MAG TPA: M14 family zinc carboxypeptidase [Thermoleophilaceae bacterium]|jgi:murein tripeptide amidase MpaA